MESLITENKKRTRTLFNTSVELALESGEDEKRQAYKRRYTGFATIPGVKTTETMRKGALKNIGLQSSFPSDQPQFDSQNPSSAVAVKQKVEEAKQSNQVDKSSLQVALYEGASSSSVALRKLKVVDPDWHAPWKLKTVIAGHHGWVHCLAMDPLNQFFVSGSSDRTIKFWDLVQGKCLVTLTGHINTVRGLVLSEKHPYLFSVGEDKMVKCWDLEQNKVVRSYHGHLSGIYCAALHPDLDLLITGGRDATARVWDIRTRNQVHCLGGHSHSVESIKCQKDEPQVVTASHDKSIKFWDIRKGTCFETLTHHKKGIKALVLHPQEYTFASGGADKIRVWKCPEGHHLRALDSPPAIVNCLGLSPDNVLVSGTDNGSLNFFDWKSGHMFQTIQSPLQPGSLECESAIFDVMFDKSGQRMITAECDKSIKIWQEDPEATPETHPIVYKPE